MFFHIHFIIYFKLTNYNQQENSSGEFKCKTIILPASPLMTRQSTSIITFKNKSLLKVCILLYCKKIFNCKSKLAEVFLQFQNLEGFF